MVLLTPRQIKPYFAVQGPTTAMAGMGRLGGVATQQRQPMATTFGRPGYGGRDKGPRSLTIAQAAELLGKFKIQVEAGKANPSPPVGPVLGSKGLNIMAFCKDYNALTKDKKGIIPAEVTYFADKSFK